MTRTISTRISYSGNGVWLAEATDGRGFMNDHGCWHTIWMSQGTYYSADDAARACSQGMGLMMTLIREETLAAYRSARDAYYIAVTREDAAFIRWFKKRQNGEPTNGAAATRLANLTNYASAELASAQDAVYQIGSDPWDIDDADGVERTPVGS